MAFIFSGTSILVICFVLKTLSIYIIYILFGILGYLISRSRERVSTQLFLIVYGFAVFASVILFFIYFERYDSPYIGGGSDDLSFDEFAKIVAKNLWYYNAEEIGSLIDFSSHNSKGYIYLVSLLVRLGDLIGEYNTMISRLFNCFLLGQTAILTRSIAAQIGLNPRQALTAALWVGLFPMMVFVAIHTFRDIPMAFLLLLGLKATLRISTRRDYIVPLLCTLAFILVTLAVIELRFLYVIPCSAMIVAAWLSRLFPRTVLRTSYIFALLTAFIFLMQLTLNSDILFFINTLEYVDGYTEGLKEGGERGAIDGGAVMLFSLPFPWQYLARILYAIVTPIPIYYQQIEWNILGLGSIMQFYYSFFVLLGIKLIYRDMKLWPLLFGFAIIFLSYAMGSFVFRHITAWFPFAVLLGVIGYERYRHHRKLVFAVSTLAIGLAGFMYIFLKI